MKSLPNGETEIEVTDVLKAIKRIIATFKSDEVLSEFEKGQVDGLRWCQQIIEEWE